jgi:type VI secretion system secreted protein VgrG
LTAGAFQLRVGDLGADELAVVAFSGREALSAPFRFDVVVLSGTDLLTATDRVLGAPALFVMASANGASRAIHGIITSLTGHTTVDGDKGQFSLRLSPRMALLRRRKNSRIFQGARLTDIVNAVLDEHRVPRRWNLTRSYPARDYCVQYRETDHDFVHRLCAEAGIFYYFKGPSQREVESGLAPDGMAEEVVFCDEAKFYPPMAGPGIDPGALVDEAIVLDPPQLAVGDAQSAMVGRERIFELSYRRSIRSKSVALRDYDFEKPLLQIGASTRLGETAPGAAPRAPKLLADEPAAGAGDLEMYEHHGEYGETDVSKAHAAVQLEQHRSRAMVGVGRSTCRALAAGHRFVLSGSSQPGLDGEPLAVVRVSHEALPPDQRGGEARYTNRFECVSAFTPYRPKRPKRDLSQVLESAVVVGPPGQEIFTDKHGRIKVQFHWDRRGLNNEHSSCWMRVSQAWAGTGWGFQFIPRVGMEVLVSFLGGDEDRPVVMGAVYNATHPPPFAPPLGQTKSGIKTQSVGGAGGNELSFEDAAGGEVIYLKAQRDLAVQVARDHDTEVAGDQRTVVTGLQKTQARGDRHAEVGGTDTRSVAGADRLVVVGDQEVSVAGARNDLVTGGVTAKMNGSVIRNSGNRSETVEGYASTAVGTEDSPTGHSTFVYGALSMDATKSITLRSDKRVTLECGDSSISLAPEGVRIDAKHITLHAKEKLVLMGDGPAIELAKELEVLAKTIKMFSKGGSVELDDQAAKMDGPLVKLNCGAGDQPSIDDDEEEPTTKTFRWKCLDRDLKPYKNKTYQLVTQGFKKKDQTDGDGVIEVQIPEDAFSASLTLWADEYPEGERLHYTIQLGDLAPSTSVYGALVRLRNLGYYSGADTDELTPELMSALMSFQGDHDIEVTGELDSATSGKLDEVHLS